MAMTATRKSATAAISLIKSGASATSKFPHIRYPNLETPNFLGAIRSLSQIHRSSTFDFNPVRNSAWPLSGAGNGINGVGSVSYSFRTLNTRFYHMDSTKDEVKNMAEKRNIRDHKRRLLAEKYELRRKLHKALISDPDLPMELRERHRHKLSKLPRNSSFTRVRNRCIFSGRSRAVYRQFRTSRIVFRSLASNGALMGITKASWRKFVAASFRHEIIFLKLPQL